MKKFGTNQAMIVNYILWALFYGVFIALGIVILALKIWFIIWVLRLVGVDL